MRLKAAIEVISEIEATIDVNSLVRRGIRVWPLLRIQLWFKLREWDPSSSGLSRETWGWFARVMRYLKGLLSTLLGAVLQPRQIRSLFHQLEAEKIGMPIDVLFISRTGYHTDLINGHRYDRHIDPIIDDIGDTYSHLKMELPTRGHEKTLPRHNKTFFIPRPFKVPDRSGPKKGSASSGIENFAKLEAALLSITGGKVSLNEALCVSQFEALFSLQALFKKILERLRPRAVFGTCYYDDLGLALCLACNDLGIRIVDLQHGKQGRYHGAYTHWTAIPAGGYRMLPSHFWVWGNPTKRDIEGSRAGCDSAHSVVVGGNRWLASWIRGDMWEPNPNEASLLEDLQQFDRIILFSMQPLEPPIPEHVLAAMRGSPPNWKWLIRVHPGHKYLKSKIHEIMAGNAIKNYEVERTTEAVLYRLLKHADHHITCYSSVLFEALAFGVPTTVVDKQGFELYEEHIGRGTFGYAETEDQLIQAIGRPRQDDQLKGEGPYIETADQLARTALEVIMRARTSSEIT